MCREELHDPIFLQHRCSCVCVDGGGGRAEQVPVPTDGIKPVGTFPHTWTRGQFRVSPKSISTRSCMIATGATGRVDTVINTIAVIVDLV